MNTDILDASTGGIRIPVAVHEARHFPSKRGVACGHRLTGSVGLLKNKCVHGAYEYGLLNMLENQPPQKACYQGN
ncbi:MAG: hypothetical protein ACU83O_08120 [Gammaproteobacteria bacterium]